MEGKCRLTCFYIAIMLTMYTEIGILEMNITKHAWQRMKERGVTPEMVGRILTTKILSFPTGMADGSRYVFGTADEREWVLVVTSDESTLISVRRAHGKELALWQ